MLIAELPPQKYRKEIVTQPYLLPCSSYLGEECKLAPLIVLCGIGI